MPSELAADFWRFYDQVELGYRQSFAFAMRHFYEIPQEKIDEDGLVMPRAKADRAVLRHWTLRIIRSPRDIRVIRLVRHQWCQI